MASDAKILQILDQLIELAPALTNPLLNTIVASLTSFIVSIQLLPADRLVLLGYKQQ